MPSFTDHDGDSGSELPGGFFSFLFSELFSAYYSSQHPRNHHFPVTQSFFPFFHLQLNPPHAF